MTGGLLGEFHGHPPHMITVFAMDLKVTTKPII